MILNRYIYYSSNPFNRGLIDIQGLRPQPKGDAWLSDTPIEGEALFFTNSENKEELFDSTYDDDLYRIDTTLIGDITFKPDPNFAYNEGDAKNYGDIYIYTHQPIPRHAIELIYEGTGDSTF